MMSMTKILITRPKHDLATSHTYKWADPIIKYALNLGYDVLDYRKKAVTHDKINYIINKFDPDIYIHFGHGCPANLQGQYSCIISSQSSFFQSSELKTDDDVSNDDIMCRVSCSIMPNIELLCDRVVIAYSCHSAKKMGIDAIDHGAKAYIGWSDYLMFITDSLNTEQLFVDPLINISKKLLDGNTLDSVKKSTDRMFDRYIKKYKSTKYIARLLLWDKEYLRFYGNDNLTIFT